MFIYRSNPEQWSATPITRTLNLYTANAQHPDGCLTGDDNGYKKIKTLKDNYEPLVVPAGIQIRAVHDGLDAYGNPHNPKTVLPGGLDSGKLVVRESVARALDLAEQQLNRFFAGQYHIIGLDGFRSRDRQMAAFTGTLKDHLKAHSGDNQTLTELYDAGVLADGVNAWVDADSESAAYKALARELTESPIIHEEIKDIAVKNQIPEEEVIFNLITISANSSIGPAKDRRIPLIFENNSHAGGGAIDVMLADKQGRILNPVPFDYVGKEASIDFLESDENCDALIRRIQKSPESPLAQHFKNIGMANTTMKDIHILREAIRIVHHLMTAIGATYYSSHDSKQGGENWHYEPGNIVYNLDGSVYHRAKSADEFPDSGNPGHALQKKGRDATAVWGGKTAHELAERDHGLRMAA